MANSIALATKFLPILDAIYKRESLTARMDAPTEPIEFGGANEVKIFKLSMVGLGNYSRANGYPKGDVTGTWETLQLLQERGRELSVDRMDNEETLNQAFGRLVGEFMRTQVIPEIDAYRFAKYADWSGVGAATPAVLSNTTTLEAIDVATQTLDDADVPPEGRLLFISSTVATFLRQQVTRFQTNANADVSRIVRRLDEMEVIKVPATRFYTEITLDDGSSSSSGGYIKEVADGVAINFLMLHPTAVLQATKFAMPKVFSPDENQTADAWKFQYRHYHDAFVYDNKLAGVYVHASTS